MKYKIWDGQETLITPIGEILTADQVKARYPMSTIPGMKFIICDSPISLGVFMEYLTTKQTYRKVLCNLAITDGMTQTEIDNIYADYDAQNEAEFLYALSYFEENPPKPQPTAEERIAAALEFQNILALPNV